VVYLRVIKCLGGKFGEEKKDRVLNLRENKCPVEAEEMSCGKC